MQPPTTIHNHLKNNPQPSTTTCNYPQPSIATQKPPTTIHNYPKNHPQPSTTQKLLKKAKTSHKKWCYSTLDVHTETDVEFW